MASSSARAFSILISCFERLRNLVTNDVRFPLCDESLIFLDDALQRLDVWAADVRGGETLEDVLAWLCQINHTASVLYVLASSLDRAIESMEKFLTPDGDNLHESNIMLPADIRQNLEDAATDLAVYVLPLKLSRALIPENERTASRAYRVNDEDLTRAIVFEEGRNAEHTAISFPKFPDLEPQHFLGVAIEKSAFLRVQLPFDTLEMNITSETKTYHSLLLQSIWSDTLEMSADGLDFSRHVRYPSYITTYHLHPSELTIGKAVAKSLQNGPVLSSDLYLISGLKVLHHRESESAARQHILAARVTTVKESEQTALGTNGMKDWRCDEVKGWILNKQLNNIPRAAEFDFVGRDHTIGALKKVILPSNSTSVQEGLPERPIFILHGERGSGKTQIALRFAELYKSRFWAFFWVDGTTITAFEQSLKEIAVLVGLEQEPKAGLAWLGEQENWLLIIDNTEIPLNQFLENCLPPGKLGSILITTRNGEYGHIAQPPTDGVFQLKGLEREESITLFLRKAQRTITDPELRGLAEPIVRMIGYSPLAISGIGAEARNYRGTLKQFTNTKPTLRSTGPSVDNVRSETDDHTTSSKLDARSSWAAQNVLTFDGGGVRGYYSLLHLQYLMKCIRNIEEELNADRRMGASNLTSFSPFLGPKDFSFSTSLDSSCLPCHYFDYIGGTSTGGLITIMLANLRMSVDDCLMEFDKLSGQVFGNPRPVHHGGELGIFVKNNKYSTSNLENAIKDLLRRRGELSDDHDDAMQFRTPKGLCRAIVIASQSTKSTLYDQVWLFRSYDNFSAQTAEHAGSILNPGRGTNLAAWKVARAATALNLYFKPLEIAIDDGPIAHKRTTRTTTSTEDSLSPLKKTNQRRTRIIARFSDAGLTRANNPSTEVLKELGSIFHGGPKKIANWVSIGTASGGFPRGISRTRWLLRETMPLIDYTELEHQSMHYRAGEFDYYRLNEPNGLPRTEMDDWKPRSSNDRGSETITVMRDAFHRWVANSDNQEKVKRAARSLVEIRRARTLDRSKWERFALGRFFTCPARDCYLDPDEIWHYRDSFIRHLQEDHGYKKDDVTKFVQESHRDWEYKSPDTYS